MKDLPILVKPYYTIDEAYNRLKIAGAHLDQVDDIFLLIRNNMLKVSLLLNQYTTLIKADFARPYEFEESLGYEPSQEDFDFYVSGLKHTETEARQQILEINNANWMIPDFLRSGQINISSPPQKEVISLLGTNLSFVEQAIKYDAIQEVSPHKPIVVTPMFIDRNNEDKNLIKGIYEYDFTGRPSVFGFSNQAAVHWNGQGYFVCKSFDSYFAEMINVVIELSGDTKYWPTYTLDTRLIPNLIKSKNFVVTKAAIQSFEQEHLKVDHGVIHNGTPDYLNSGSPYYAEELDIAIQVHNAIFKDKYGNPHQSNSERIISWLCKHFPEQSKSEAFLKRIRTIVLPKK